MNGPQTYLLQVLELFLILSFLFPHLELDLATGISVLDNALADFEVYRLELLELFTPKGTEVERWKFFQPGL